MTASTRRYRISHHTTYRYDEPVTDSYGLACCRPRDLPGQRVLEHELWTDPGHADLHAHRDVEANQITYFHVTEPHRRLTVSATSIVERDDLEHDLAVDRTPWEAARPMERAISAEAVLASEYVSGSPLVDVDEIVTAFARSSFPPGRPLVQGLVELVHRVNEFEYEPGSTTVTTRVADVVAARRGVCQDFAHVTIAALRSMRLAARYVSGYLATDPPPGQPRLVGADATHAWVECWIPGGGWVAVDPTNAVLVGDRHVTVAWGRDYGDVPPVKGVIFTDAQESRMSVSVDVVPL